MGLLPNLLTIPGLEHGRAEVNGIWLHYVRGGLNKAQPIVLLHGFPESWLMWRHILPALLERYHVVAVDLRGYGDSAKPEGEAGYDKGTMADDIAALINVLGLERPLLVGHDRGGRVARRYALDRPDTLRGLALLDILPVEYVYDRLSAAEVSERYWHWVFHLVAELPEELIAGNEEIYLARFFSRTPGLLEGMRADGTWLEYRRCWRQPGAVAAVLNDYRATFRHDVPRYRAERKSGRKLTVPTLVLWGNRGNLSNQPVVDIWREVATDVRGQVIPGCGHYLPEEQPDVVITALLKFAAERFAADSD
jgi:pimeloyl-ACP methyl ester carboxylesterase